MSTLLSTLITQPTPSAPKIVVYGGPGVGKTTFAAQAGATLIDCENGAGGFPGLVRTPYLQTWPEIEAWLREFAQAQKAPCQVLAIDTLDWCIMRIIEHVCTSLEPDQRKLNAANGDLTNTLGAAHGGYMKAREVVANVVSRRLLPTLNAINAKGVLIMILAHAHSGKITTPEGITIKSATPDIPEWIAPLIKEWADAILYASRNPAQDNARQLTTEDTPTVMAKNRYGLPPVIAMDWTELNGRITECLQRRSAKKVA